MIFDVFRFSRHACILAIIAWLLIGVNSASAKKCNRLFGSNETSKWFGCISGYSKSRMLIATAQVTREGFRRTRFDSALDKAGIICNDLANEIYLRA